MQFYWHFNQINKISKKINKGTPRSKTESVDFFHFIEIKV